MIKAKLGDRLEAWLPRLFPFLFWGKLSPTVLTVTGAVLSLAAATVFALGSFPAAAVLLLLGGVFDLADGAVARRNGTTTRFGAFLDSTLDRLADMAVLVGLMMHYAGAGQPGSVLLAGIALIAGVMTSYAKARAEPLGLNVRAGVLERGERVALVVLGGLTGWMVPVLWILAGGGIVTVVQRFTLVYRQLEGRDAPSRAGEQP